MAVDDPGTELTVADVEPSGAQTQTAVWRHPDRDTIIALLHKRTPQWIEMWLEERYPLEDEDGEPHPLSRQHAKLRLSARAVEKYRRDYMPECVPGVDLLPIELEDLVGRHAPRPLHDRHELEAFETLQQVALMNLTRSMAADEGLEMLTPTTLEAQKQAFNIFERSLDAKTRLGIAGYEASAKKMEIEQRTDLTSRNINVELHGQKDPITGEIIPVEQRKVDALREVLARGPDEAIRTVEDAQHVDGSVEDVDDEAA